MAPRRHLPADLQTELEELIDRAKERGYEIRATIANPKPKPTRGRGRPSKSEHATLAMQMLWQMKQGKTFTQASELVAFAAGKDAGQLRSVFRRLSAIRSYHDLALQMWAAAAKIDVITRQLFGDDAGDLVRQLQLAADVKSTDTVEGRAIQRSVEFRRVCNEFAQVQKALDRLPQGFHDLFDRYWDNLVRAELKS